MIPARVRPGRPAIAAAVAVAALIGGAGVALAATSSPSAPRAAAKARAAVAAPSLSRSCRQVKLPLRGFPQPGRIVALPGQVPFGFGPLGAIHGQFVAPKPGGGYQTIDTQRGTVTAVSASSLTVKSKDGYTKTYQVTSSTKVDAKRAGIGSVKTGQTVSVLATVHGSSATATQIVDFTALPKLPKTFKLPRLSKPFKLPKGFKLPKSFKPGFGHVFRIVPCAKLSASR
jgi:hypothetical protein